MANNETNLSWLPVVGTMINAWSQERNFEENANQARIQREWQEKMWNKNNLYNTPLAQKERLEAAGINPFSVLAQGGADTGVSSSPAQPYDRAEANFHSPMDENAFMNSFAMQAQTKGVELDNDAKRINLQFLYMKNVKELMQMDAEIGVKISEKERNHEDASRLYWERETLRNTMSSVIRKLEGEAEYANVQADYSRSRFELMNALDRVEIRLKQSGIDVNSKTIDKLVSDIATNKKIQQHYDSLIELNQQNIKNLVDAIYNNVRTRQSSRLHDSLDQKKVSADITIEVIKTFMEANQGKLGPFELRQFQTSAINALEEAFGDVVPTSVVRKAIENATYGKELNQKIHTPQHGGVR